MSQEIEKVGGKKDERLDLSDMGLARAVLRRHTGPVFILENLSKLSPVNPVAESFRRNSEDDDYDLHVDRLLAVAMMAGLENRSETAVIPIDGEIAKTIEYTMSPYNETSVIIIGKDVTLEHNLRQALSDSRGLFKDLVDVAADFAWEADTQGVFRFISTHGILGYHSSQLVGQSALEFLDFSYKQPDELPFMATQTVRGEDVWMQHRDGHACCLQIAAMPVFDSKDKQIGVRGVGHDVTIERLHQTELKRIKMREGLVDYIVNAIRTEVTPDGMLETAAAALAHSCLASSCALYFCDSDGHMKIWATFGDLPPATILEDMRIQVEQMGDICQKSFNEGFAMGTVSRYRDEVNGAIILWRDAQEQAFSQEVMTLLQSVEPQLGIALRQALDQKELEILSRTDPLTGLLNRRAFAKELKRSLTRAHREKNTGALIYVDLDNFKPVNDTLGHEAGDKVLQKLTDILNLNTREYDLVARVGGDEFAIWFDQMSYREAESKAKQVLEASGVLKSLSASPDQPLSLSIGVGFFEPDGREDPEDLIARSDQAMYKAKKSGKNRIYIDADR